MLKVENKPQTKLRFLTPKLRVNFYCNQKQYRT